MSKQSVMLLALVVVVALGVAAIAAQQAQERKALEQRNAELDSRAQKLEQQVEQTRTAEQTAREEAARHERRISALKQENQELRQPPSHEPTCVDSDADHGRDQIYFRGTVEVRSDGGTGSQIDHCRLDQLVEFSCRENPPGSGRLISEAKLTDCPAGSRCVSGECVQ